MSIPDFDHLPAVEGMPQGCAWGVFDKDGKKDLLGTLNLLTPAVVAAAAAEVKDGVSISLNWPLNGIKIPIPGRKAPVHKFISFLTPNELTPSTCHGWDDELEFNTQFSSQWDSLCHMQHQPSGLAYNGTKVTLDGLSSPQTSAENSLPTLDHWHAHGGLVGRGVLIDFKGYMDAQNKPYHCLDGYRITVEDIENVARHQKVEFRHGDILIIRTGVTEIFENLTPEDLAKLQQFRLSGLHGSEDTARWVWNRHFSAVAGDSSSFEAFPPLKADGTEGSVGDLAVLHQYFLAMFGLPIGELWDLKALSAYCRKTGRYSFMLTSAPLNHPGLVASPPNALAIF
ncbi:hypothetical protein M406DRAFT_297135 [Cryphonectria parasitica EP155]|uniref:Cyclase n=1 Tax=Cryphonectria parasitica (strain ATCC 38755 / EP155) TaxID=660469 RepID=A0A9P4XSZ7_CRYP1|nr:uncharacterized protein M406DRAFT_297135 [Cryphonectria parasitica EP155]KAF3760358.1 hypothetical protein M406DRAFT_297135 [Cryphonectria parasitica EP155]